MTASTPAPTASADTDAWLTARVFAAILALFLAITFLGVAIGHDTFFQRDFGVFTYPVAAYFRECFWRGQAPLWDPFNNCGVPLLAQWNTATLYPPSLFYLIFPLSWSLGVFQLAHLFFAGLGMFLLARRWTNNSLAAAVAGLVFAFNGLSWHMLIWISNEASYAWMPWVVLAVENTWSRRGLRPIALAAIAGAMQMLAGAPEIIILTWAFLGALWLCKIFSKNAARLSLILRFAAIPILIAGLSAAQLLPFLELLKHSQRDPNFNGADWAMPAYGLANFLAPLFHTSAGPYGIRFQYDQYWTSSYYLGAGVIALAVIAVARVREPRVLLLALVTVLSLAMAIGPAAPLYRAVKFVLPQLSIMRYPIKFVVLAVFLIPLLAAYAVKWRRTAPQNYIPHKTVAATVLALLLIMAAILFAAWKFPLDRDNWPATWHNTLARAAFLILVPVMLLSMRRGAAPRRQMIFSLALLALLWLDISTHAPDLNPTVPRAVYDPGLVRDELKLPPAPPADAAAAEPRFFATSAAVQTVRYTALPKTAADYLCHRLALYCNANLLDDLPKVDGFYSLLLGGNDHVLRLLYNADSRGQDIHGLKDFLGIGLISAPDTGPGTVLNWLPRETALPLITAGQQPIFTGFTNTLLAMFATNFDARQTVYLVTELQSAVTAQKTRATVTPTHFDAQHLTATIDASAPAMVVIAQSWYPAWHACVDDEPTPLYPANLAFQALQVPSGHHQIKIIYEDEKFHIGLAISLATLVLVIGGLFWPASGETLKFPDKG